MGGGLARGVYLCAFAVLLVNAACTDSGLTNGEGAAPTSSGHKGEALDDENTSAAGSDKYCERLDEVARVVAAHAREFVDLDEEATNPEPLRQSTLAVVRTSAQARAVSPEEVKRDWTDFVDLYQMLADALQGNTRPFDATLELEEGEVEWSSAVYEAGANIDFDAQVRCGFDPNLRSDVG